MNGIMGISKPIIPNQTTPKQKLRNIGKRGGKQAINAKRATAEELEPASATLPESLNKVGDQLTVSTPPETAQEVNSGTNENNFITGTAMPMTMDVPVVISTYQKHPTHIGGKAVRNSQQPNAFDDHSLGSQDHVTESRLNTGTIQTSHGKTAALTDDDQNNDASKTLLADYPESGGKRNRTKQRGVHKLRGDSQHREQMFEQKSLMKAMEQTIEMFESFGADEKPHFKYNFGDEADRSPPSTQHYNKDASQVLD